MDKKKKLGSKIATHIFITILVIFTVIYISGQTGYYEYQNHKQVELTEEKIEEYEKDLKKGKNIKTKDYLKETDISYENNFSTAGKSISEGISYLITNGTDATIKFFSKLFEG